MKILKDEEYGIEYELEYIDSTHISLGGVVWHIAQLVNSKFYREIIEFINQHKNNQEL
jgi:hypothetical protein